MKNIFYKLRKQIFHPFNIIVILTTLLILFYPILNHMKVKNLSQLLQGGTMLLYSLYIPIAIAILESELKYRSQSNISLKIIFTKIFNISTHLIIIISTLISVLLIDTENNILKFIGLIIYISSNVWLVNSICKSKEYLASSNKAKYGFELIKNSESKFIVGINDIFDAIPNNYSNIKNVDSKNYFKIWNYEEENSFIELIFNQTDKYNKGYQFQNIYNTLNIIYKNITKINLSYKNKLFITKLFEYIYSFWCQYQESAENKNNSSKSIELYEIYRISEEILIKILQKSLQDPHPVSATIDFFEVLDRHLQEHKDKVIQFKGKDEKYLEFFKYFGQRVITEILNMPDEYSARDVLEYQWSKLDRNWKINLSNLQSENDSQITNYWFNIMWEYISNIWRKDFNRPKKIEYKDIKKVNILINVFIPDINPEPFMQITELWFWSKEANAVKMYIENRVFTGIMSNVEVLSFDYNTTEEEENSVWDKRNKEQIQKAIDIIVKIYERYGLNKAFCENIENQIKKINRNELDDNKLDRLDSLQKTIELIAERFK